jgi:hypothetical protein
MAVLLKCLLIISAGAPGPREVWWMMLLICLVWTQSYIICGRKVTRNTQYKLFECGI